MPGKITTDDALINAFRSYLTGSLVSGIAHNLNGMLQIVSMQIEFLMRELAQDKRKINDFLSDGSQSFDIQDPAFVLLQELNRGLAKKVERITALQEAILNIEGMSNIFAGRGQYPKGPIIVEIDKAIREEISFLKADLFFKHQVNVIFDIPSLPFTIHTDDRLLKDLIDVTMTMCINQLKPLEKSEKKEIKIVLENDGPHLKLGFEHTGRPFALNEGGGDDRSLECIYPQDEILLWRFVVPIHAILKLIAGKLDAAFQISPHKIGFVFTSTT